MTIVAREKSLDDVRNNFRINDLKFVVPPTNIAVDHVDMSHRWSTMRTRHPVTVPSGRGELLINVKFIVVPEELWRLHRLIQEFHFTPIWQIENNYVRSQVIPGISDDTELDPRYAMAACAAAMSVTTLPNQPGAFEVTLTLPWFNYLPFTRNFQYKKDWITTLSGERKTIYDVPVVSEYRGELDDSYGPEDTTQGPYEEIMNRDASSALSPEAMSEDALDLNDLSRKLWKDEPTDPVDAYESNVYVTYLNYLQALALQDFFGPGVAGTQKIIEGGGLENGKAFPVPYDLYTHLNKEVRFTYREYSSYQPPDNIAKAFAAMQERINLGDQSNRLGYARAGGSWVWNNRWKTDLKSKVPDVEEFIRQTASEWGIPGDLMLEQVYQESNGDPMAIGPNTQSGNAKGIGQFIDSTADTWSQRLTQQYGRIVTRQDIQTDPQWGIRAMAAQMRENYDLYGGEWFNALAVYNGGNEEKILGAFNDDGSIDIRLLPTETQEYIVKIANLARQTMSIPEGVTRGINTLAEDGEYLTQDDMAALDEEVKRLSGEGWRWYSSPHVALVIYREHSFSIPTDGSPSPYSDCVCTSQGFAVGNHFAMIPILSWQWPTYQYMGGQDSKLFFSFVSVNNQRPDQIGPLAQKLVRMKNVLEANSRLFRFIPGSWTARVDSASSDLLGVRKVIYNRIQSESVPEHPGLYSINVEMEATGDLTLEKIDRDGVSNKGEFYKKLVEKLIPYIKAYHTKGVMEETSAPSDRYLKINLSSSALKDNPITEAGRQQLAPTTAFTNEEYNVVDGTNDISTRTADPHEEIMGDLGAATNSAREWDAVIINKASLQNGDDETVWMATEFLVMGIRGISLGLSPEYYGGLSEAEIRQEDLYGLEKFVFPVYDTHIIDFISPIDGGRSYIEGVGIAEDAPNTGETEEINLGVAQALYSPSAMSSSSVARLLTPLSPSKSIAAVVREVHEEKRINSAAGLIGSIAPALTFSAPNAFYQELTSPVGISEELPIVTSLDQIQRTSKEAERTVLKYLKSAILETLVLEQLYQLAPLRIHPEFKPLFDEYFGANISNRAACYTDLPLPPHPALGKDFYTEADFYFYNDSDYEIDELEKGENALWVQQMRTLMKGAYDSWKSFKTGQIEKPKLQVQIEDPEHEYTIQNEGDEEIEGDDGSKIAYESHNIDKKLETLNGIIPEANGDQNVEVNERWWMKRPDLDVGFTPESLDEIAKIAAQDIQYNKYAMRRAFPSFRVEFIEEPTEEVIWEVHNRAHAYSAVQSIVITKDKYSPADLCIVELQNISGVLDGSLLGAITDEDYAHYASSMEERNSFKQVLMDEYRKLIHEGESIKDFFNAIVVREGIGIRVKVGYTNDPRNLETKFIGRVVEVVPTENSDSLSLVCQSFGVELVQNPKGITEDKNSDEAKKDKTLAWTNPFTSTYDVISEALKSPEVLHFGRWEFGKRYMRGEARDSRTDEEKYKRFWKVKTGLAWLKGDLNSATASSFYAPTSTTLAVGDTFGQAGESAFAVPFHLLTLQPKKALDDYKKLFGIGSSFVEDLIIDRYIEQVNSPVDDNVFVPNMDNWVKYSIFDPSGKTRKESAIYYFLNTTIWDTIQEMTLRHPGWIAATAPYGSRSTLFFGVPTQRYWAQPASNELLQRVHESQDKTDRYQEMIDSKMVISGLEMEEFRAHLDILLEVYNMRFRPFRRYHLITSRHDIIDNTISVSSRNTFNTVAVRYGKDITKGIVDYIKIGGGITTSTAAGFLGGGSNIPIPGMGFGLKGARPGKWKGGTPGAIAGMLRGIKQYVPKDVSTETDRKTHMVKLNPSMRDEDVSMEVLDLPNCRGKNLAHRYGTAYLCRGLSAMYQGELVCISNPKIKPHDILFIMDEYNDVAGPVVVKSITTMLSPNTGMLDVIVPEAYIITNEQASDIVFNGMRACIGHYTMKLFQDTPSILAGSFAGGTGTPAGTPWKTAGSNLVSAISGGLQYYFWTRKKNAVTIIPLQKHGEPYTAGIPTDMIDTIWHNFKGSVQLFVDDITKGYIERHTMSQILGVKMWTAYGGEMSLLDNVLVGTRIVE